MPHAFLAGVITSFTFVICWRRFKARRTRTRYDPVALTLPPSFSGFLQAPLYDDMESALWLCRVISKFWLSQVHCLDDMIFSALFPVIRGKPPNETDAEQTRDSDSDLSQSDSSLDGDNDTLNNIVESHLEHEDDDGSELKKLVDDNRNPSREHLIMKKSSSAIKIDNADKFKRRNSVIHSLKRAISSSHVYQQGISKLTSQKKLRKLKQKQFAAKTRKQANKVVKGKKQRTYFNLILERFTLGKRPPQINNVKSFRTPSDDCIILDFDVDWISHGAQILLSTILFGKKVPLVRATNLKLQAKTRVEINLLQNFLAFRDIHVGFVNTPKIEFRLELLGLSGLNAMYIPFLSSYVRHTIKKILDALMLWPKRFCQSFDSMPPISQPSENVNTSSTDHALKENVESNPKLDVIKPGPQFLQGERRVNIDSLSMMRGQGIKSGKVYMARGIAGAANAPSTKAVLRVRVIQAISLRSSNSQSSSSFNMNTYCRLKLGSQYVSTKTCINSNNPVFDDYFELFVKSPTAEILEIKVYDAPDAVGNAIEKIKNLSKGKPLGVAWVNLEELIDSSGWTELYLALINTVVTKQEDMHGGFIQVKLLLEEFHNPNDIESDEAVRKKFQLKSKQRQESLLKNLSLNDNGNDRQIAGYWQIHILEAIEWSKYATHSISDARCDIKCRDVIYRTKPTHGLKWDEFFEFEVHNPLQDFITITGVDEDPFVRDSLIGGCVISLKGVGDVEPQEIFVQMLKVDKDRISDPVRAGWLHIWVTYKSLYLNDSDWFSASNKVVVNQEKTVMRARRTVQEQPASMSGDDEHKSKLMQKLENLDVSYLLNLAKRVPRSLFYLGGEVVGNMTEFISGENANFDEYEDESTDYFQNDKTDPKMDNLFANVERMPNSLENTPTILYQLHIKTGTGKDAGTKANVWAEIVGCEEAPEAGIHATHEKVFSERKKLCRTPELKEFRPGTKHNFILKAPISLKNPIAIHIWHDNSGPNPGWFLDSIKLRLLSSKEKITRTFTCQQWLAEGDGFMGTEISLHADPTLQAKHHKDQDTNG